MKLTKVQTEVLQASLEVIRTTGMNTKPITVHVEANAHLLIEMPKSYRTYCKQMAKLLDAGVIVRGTELSYAYIDEAKAREALRMGAF